MSSVLVTGVNGFVGQHLVAELASNGHVVIGIGGHKGSENPPAGLNDYRVVDLRNSSAVNQLDFQSVEGVIHLAGLAAVGPSFDAPLEYLTTNTGIEINLLEAALAQNAKPKFVIISSGSLYDPKADLPLSETSVVLPNSPYAVSKLAQEELAQYYAVRGFEITVARPFNHIGPGQNPGFIVPDIAQQIIHVERGQSSTITVGNLEAKRDYTDVRDIVQAYRLLLEKGKSGEIYNVCSGQAHSGREILNGLLKAVGKDMQVVQDPAKMRPSDAPEIYGSHDKLTTDTGWQPTISLEQTLQDVIDDWRNR